ncbi:MAG: hypothetical protein Q9190_004888 [Brigantiaea leucoxantha]
MDSFTAFGPSVHISTHPCLRAKLSQLRSIDANARETKTLVHDITLIVGCEALAACLKSTPSGTGETPVGSPYTVETILPHLALVPILRSGLGMLDDPRTYITLKPAIQTLLPDPVPVHHLGLFREPTTLQPVEYYNNLPYHRPSDTNPTYPDLAILLDPIIATGGTSVAAIQTLLEWGVKKVIVISVLGSEAGVKRAAAEGAEGQVEIWLGGCDKDVNDRGMIRPGMGDVGDRLFLTIGK